MLKAYPNGTLEEREKEKVPIHNRQADNNTQVKMESKAIYAGHHGNSSRNPSSYGSLVQKKKFQGQLERRVQKLIGINGFQYRGP